MTVAWPFVADRLEYLETNDIFTIVFYVYSLKKKQLVSGTTISTQRATLASAAIK